MTQNIKIAMFWTRPDYFAQRTYGMCLHLKTEKQKVCTVSLLFVIFSAKEKLSFFFDILLISNEILVRRVENFNSIDSF